MPHSFRVHPATDFAKKNLFSVLSSYIDFEEGACALDSFADTGSISVELVSRGCDQIISIKKDHDHHASIYKIIRGLKTDRCLPIHGDAFKYVRGDHKQFDFIFTDPPYELRGPKTLPGLISENNLLEKEGLFVLGHGKTDSFESHPHFIEGRMYDDVNFSFFQLSKL